MTNFLFVSKINSSDFYSKITSISVITGINTSYTNYGMYGTFFPMHVEDSNLASMNILHHGAPKTWYGVPAAMATKLEDISKNDIAKETGCDLFIRHKSLIYPPNVLHENGVDFGKVSLCVYQGLLCDVYQIVEQIGHNYLVNCSFHGTKTQILLDTFFFIDRLFLIKFGYHFVNFIGPKN